ncbi:P-loop containing nucleoside triphosphate hydrolase protein [Hypoxylon cercidicola]|nr:P-loop containing nucleoside triphosphate hydrolase protein [Hypoxylon cercidicola]
MSNHPRGPNSHTGQTPKTDTRPDGEVNEKPRDAGSTEAEIGKLSKKDEESEVKNRLAALREALEDEEDPEDMLWRAIHQHRDWRTTLEEQREHADMRLAQSKAYADLVEYRLLDIEEKLSKILDEPSGPSRLRKGPAPPSNKLEIKELDWQEFRKCVDTDTKTGSKTQKHVPELDSTPKHVIEILMEEPRLEVARTTTRSHRDDEQIDRTAISVNHDKSWAPHRIRIRSPILIKVLGEVTGLRTVIGPHGHILVFLKPFKLLVTHAQDLRNHLERLQKKPLGSEEDQVRTDAIQSAERPVVYPAPETEADEAQSHLRLLCEMIDEYLQPKLKRFQTKSISSTVSFDDLWYLFRTGDEVVTTGASQIQLFRVLKVTGGRDILVPSSEAPANHASNKLKDKGYSSGSFIIECFYINYDGSQYGPVNETFQIRRFDGVRDVTSLPIIPLEFKQDREDIRTKLLARGEKFAQLCDPSRTAHKQYRGLTLDKRQEQVESEVIIDFQLSYIEIPENKPAIGVDNLVDDDPRELFDTWKHCKTCGNAGCCGNDIIYNDFEVDQDQRSSFKNQRNSILEIVGHMGQLTRDQMALLPPKVFGFVLRTRRWATFDIDLLQDVEYTDGWKNLVIDEKMKTTVLALVENHQRPQNRESLVDGALSAVDLVQGKGRGLIILLHGEPGVGKTSTAECVADHTKRPLFPVTCGDIGDDALKVETNLERNFQLAHKWGCVLLLDEADVFLARRNVSNTDVARNAIVSVFLRSLEYYSGILFLTTNRIGIIDRAFKSRIHLALFYPRLDKERTLKIWENNLDSLAKSQDTNARIQVQRDEILKYAKRHYKRLERHEMLPWNGRQIRNAFQTAIAIAKYEAKENSRAPVLIAEHFMKVAKTAMEFDSYLKELSQEKDDAQLAREQELRVDDWDEYDAAPRGRQLGHLGNSDKVSRRVKRTMRNSDVETDSSGSGSSGANSESDESDNKQKRKPKRRKR